MRGFVTPVMSTLIGLASLAVVFFLVNGGFQYITSSGDPERLENAKKIVRNALIGLVMVIAAGTLTAILSHAYTSSGASVAEKLPTLVSVQPAQPQDKLTTVLVDAVTGLFKTLIQSAAKPFLDALTFFTKSTPLMADNSGVFNLWLAVVGITDALFVLVVALLGFHVMSFATFGLEEIEFKHMLPKIGLVFLLVNTSIFAIDGVIGLTNAMISAVNAAYPAKSVWETLTTVVNQQGTMGLAALLIMVVFLILSVMLMIYYVLRLVTLYIGAVLSPIVFLLWLVPGFKDFSEAAAKIYLGTIFVLFIHVVILELAATIFAGMSVGSGEPALNPIMSMVVGVATILALLKTQSVLTQLSYMSMGPKTAMKLGGMLTNVVSHYAGRVKKSRDEQTPGSSGTGNRKTPSGPGDGPTWGSKTGDYARPKKPVPSLPSAVPANASKAKSGAPA
jgi:hypothetical protein